MHHAQNQNPDDLAQCIIELEALEQASKALSKQIGAAKKAKAENADALIKEKKTLQKSQIEPLLERIEQLKQTLETGHKEEHAPKAKQKGQSKNQAQLIGIPPAYLHSKARSQQSSNGQFQLSCISDLSELNTRQDILQFIEAHPQSSIYHQAPFLRAIQQSMQHRILYFVAKYTNTGHEANNTIAALVPIIEQKSRLFGYLWTSIALVNYGGILADSEQSEHVLLEHLIEQGKREGVERIEVRGIYQRAASSSNNQSSANHDSAENTKQSEWSINTDKASMWLALPQDHSSDTLLSSFKAKLRSQIKKGYTNQVTVKTGNHDLLDDFYRVFCRNMRDLGTPVYGKPFFASILAQLEHNSKLVVVYHQGQPASAAFLIQNHHTLEIPWASTIKRYNPFNLNMVLYWEVLKYACQQQCSIFDFGRSSVDASTYKFKKQWGTQAVQHYWYTWSTTQAAEQAHQQTSTNNPKFQLLIAAWKRLPLWLANLLGPHIVKYIP